jgi:hypothetical protein
MENEEDRREGKERWVDRTNKIGKKGSTIFNPSRVEVEPLPKGLVRGLFVKKRSK